MPESNKPISEYEQIENDWKSFSKTVAYKRFIEFIEAQKQINAIAASGPMEIYQDVNTDDGKKALQLEFEPEKYAYLLQRSVGCDIVKIYVEGFTNPAS